MLEQEFKFFIDHRTELVEKYNGKYIVIRGNEVLGVYDSEISAYQESINKYELGTFLIQLCSPSEDSFNQTFHSRVVFS